MISSMEGEQEPITLSLLLGYISSTSLYVILQPGSVFVAVVVVVFSLFGSIPVGDPLSDIKEAGLE